MMIDRSIMRDLLPVRRGVAPGHRDSPPGGSPPHDRVAAARGEAIGRGDMGHTRGTTPAATGRGGRVSGVAAVLVLTWLLAACGGSATPTGVPSATPPPATPTLVATAPPATRPPATPTATPVAATPRAPASPAAALAAPTATTLPIATPAPPTATPPPRAGRPTRLRIPAIRVDAAIEDVGLTADGAMDVPKDYNNTAWYEPGSRPGDQGNAAIAGHVDSKTGPAVFWDLPKLQAGDEVFVVGDDGVERRFVVTGRESYGRADAPLERIFGSTTARQLNLITCDPRSTFDRSKGGYAANVVIYATLVP